MFIQFQIPPSDYESIDLPLGIVIALAGATRRRGWDGMGWEIVLGFLLNKHLRQYIAGTPPRTAKQSISTKTGPVEAPAVCTHSSPIRPNLA